MKEKEKLNNITFIKCLMMMLVVLHHSVLFYSGSWFTIIKPAENASYLCLISDIINVFIMPVFVFASGFLFFYLKKYYNKYNNLKKDLKKRFNRLIVPYFFTALLWAIPFTIIFFNPNYKEIIKDYFLVAGPDQLWFLIMLFIEFIIFYFLSKKLKFTYLEFLIFFVITMCLSFFLNKNVFQITAINRYFIFYYYAGFLINKFELREIKTIKIEYFVHTLLIILLYCVYFFVDYSTHIILKKMVLIVLQMIIVRFVYLIIIYGNFSKIMNFKSIRVLSGNSFGIYLFHQQLIYVILYLLNGLIPPLLVSISCFLLAIALSLFISVFLGKNKITKFMFGL